MTEVQEPTASSSPDELSDSELDDVAGGNGCESVIVARSYTFELDGGLSDHSGPHEVPELQEPQEPQDPIEPARPRIRV